MIISDFTDNYILSFYSMQQKGQNHTYISSKNELGKTAAKNKERR